MKNVIRNGKVVRLYDYQTKPTDTFVRKKHEITCDGKTEYFSTVGLTEAELKAVLS